MIKTKTLWNIAIPIYYIAATLNIFAYYSVEPVLLFIIYVALVLIFMKVLGETGRQERAGVLLVCAVCWFWAGIAAIFLELVSADSQGPDVWYFYNVVTDKDFIPFNEGKIVQNAGPIYIWKIVYEFSELLGFTKGFYIGVTFNVFIVTITSLIGLKMVRVIYPNDAERRSRFIIIYASCGMFWLFGSIHLRDSMALFSITLLMLIWIIYLGKSNITNFIILIIASVVGILVLGFVRTEFVFVPGALLLAGMAAEFIGGTKKRHINILLIACLVIGLATFGYLFIDDLLGAFENTSRYNELSNVESGTNSLGNSLVINQSWPLRLVFGAIYLLLFPIPFWVGFQLDSIYHLYKSFNVILMYFLIPLCGLAIQRLIKNRLLRTPPILFMVFCAVGFIFLIGYSSLEGRHFGSFYIPIIVLALLPKIERGADLFAYKCYLMIFLLFVIVLHLAWIALKMV
jgi:hypothetical protein